MRDHLNAALGDRYLVERELGRGGMATVWLARDLRHDRVVALKVLDPTLAGAIGVERFLREIRVTARIQHPNIVPVLDSGVCPGPGGESLPWFTMTYVAGESLRQRMNRERQLPIEDAIRIAESAAAALETAHKSGVVHRDIKPENLLLAGDHTYVADFGIAKAVIDTGTERITSTGVVIGTPAYMSPEQASNDVVDERSDQYALATVLYEMLAGDPPFTRRHSASGRGAPTRRAGAADPPCARDGVGSGRSGRVARARARPRRPIRQRVGLRRGTPQSDRIARAGKKTCAARTALGHRCALIIAAAAATPFVVRQLRGAHARPSPEAQALYRRGMTSYEKRTPDGAADALDEFKAAIRLDSNYSEAWVGLAKTYVRAYERRFVFLGAARDSALRLALSALDRALAADPRNADAWLAQGMVHWQLDPTDRAPALRSFRQAVAMDSTLAQAWHQLGIASMEIGRTDEAMAAWRRTVAVAPTYTEGLSFLALGHYWGRQYDSASHWADSASAIDPAFVFARQVQGLIAVEQGNFARGAAAFSAMERISTGIEVVNSLAGEALLAARAGRPCRGARAPDPCGVVGDELLADGTHTAIYMAQPYAALGDADHAIAWLRQYAPTADTHFQLHMRCDPPFDAIANDPRFRSLLTIPKPAPPHGC